MDRTGLDTDFMEGEALGEGGRFEGFESGLAEVSVVVGFVRMQGIGQGIGISDRED